MQWTDFETLYSSVFILIYILYLITVIMGRYINQKLKRKRQIQKQINELDKSTNGFQYSKKFEQTNPISHQHSVTARTFGTFGSGEPNQTANLQVLDYNYNTAQNAERSNSDLKSVLISNSTDSKFGVDNPALGKLFITMFYLNGVIATKTLSGYWSYVICKLYCWNDLNICRKSEWCTLCTP